MKNQIFFLMTGLAVKVPVAVGTVFITLGTIGLQSVNAAVLAVNSSLDLQATANAGGGLVADTDSYSQGNTINPLNASVSAPAIFGTASVLSKAKATASWLNTSQGKVVFSDLGWETFNVSSGEAKLFGGTDWKYTFSSDTDGIFTLDYDIPVSTDTTDDFGLNGFNFIWSGFEGNKSLSLNSSGTLTRTITAGDTFTVNIKNRANIFGRLTTRKASMDGIFTWNIQTTTVPEPCSSFGLLALGTLGAASTLKRKLKPSKSAEKETTKVC
jgi:hypothetical protein